MRLTDNYLNKICIISFFSFGLWVVVSEAIQATSNPKDIWNMKIWNLRICPVLTLWFLACFTHHLLETPFVFVLFALNLLKIVSWTNLVSPWLVRFSEFRRGYRVQRHVWKHDKDHEYCPPIQYRSNEKACFIRPLLNRNLLRSIQNEHHALGEDKDIDEHVGHLSIPSIAAGEDRQDHHQLS